MSGLPPRCVVIHRRTELSELIARHGTYRQAEFFLRTRGRDIDTVVARDRAMAEALRQVEAAIPDDWRRGGLERADLDRFLFGPEDVIVAVGQDGLVANVAKYLGGQPVLGVDSEPGRNPGVLLPFKPDEVGAALRRGPEWLAERTIARPMVEVRLDDGQSLVALNEVYVGHYSHQSARYRLELTDGRAERQSSSGLLIGTGTGATGWCRSVWLERHSQVRLPAPAERALCWFVREAWPSPATGTALTEGELAEGETLSLVTETDALVAFGDGIETDRLTLTWGQRATLALSHQTLNLVTA